MKQFKQVFIFEINNYLKSKVFVGVTLVLIVLMAAVMFFPRVLGAVKGDENDPEAADSAILLLLDEQEIYPEGLLEGTITAAFPGYSVVRSESADALKQGIDDGLADYGLIVNSADDFDFLLKDRTLYDATEGTLQAALSSAKQALLLQQAGVSPDMAGQILSAQVQLATVIRGQDQISRIAYTYIMVYALYMVILIYGQMVAQSVAGEKGSRAMELLITTVKPDAMIFGKVFATCAAGLMQLVAVFGSAIVLFRVNAAYWTDVQAIEGIFNIPGSLLAYMIMFFLLGFVMYAFLFGAVGSTVSKPEELSAAITPVMLVFLAGFIVVIFSMSFGSVDNAAIVALSFIPFTSPMAMFTRIAMGTVPFWQIAVCIGILLVSVFGVGVLAAKIYRTGVLLYGNKPGLGSVIRAMRKA